MDGWDVNEPVEVIDIPDNEGGNGGIKGDRSSISVKLVSWAFLCESTGSNDVSAEMSRLLGFASRSQLEKRRDSATTC
jgi:hypothetical protein